MKHSIFSSLLLCTSLALGAAACEKQASQQDNVNSVKTDARSDLSNQPNTAAPGSPAGSDQSQTTANPNSARNTPESTLGTQQGAAVVNGANMNPSSPSNVPTSVDTATDREPRTDAAVDNANCRDAVASDNGGKTVPKKTDCPPTAQSRIKSDSTDQQVTR